MTTSKYDLLIIDYSHEGWDGDLGTDMEILDDNIHSKVLAILGETVSKGDALFQDVDAKWYKAQADGTKQPSRGLAFEAGVLNGQIRVQRRGPFQKAGWRFKVPYKLYLDDGAAGVLSHHEPPSDSQYMGWAIGNDTIFLDIRNEDSVGPAYFGTTTTQSTTTTSSSTTTTTTA